MQRGNYVVVVNPLSYSEVMSADHSLSWGVYDTVTNAFFSVSQQANITLLNALIRDKESTFQKDDRFYTIVKSDKRPIAAIVSTSNTRFYETLYHQATLTLPLGMICSIIILLVWSRTHRELNSPGRLLHRALNKRQLCVHYQPIIDIKNNRCVGAEALLRWPGFNGQVMSPVEFIPLAEKEGMSERITDYVVEEVFSDLGHFLATHPDLYISINLSATDFHSSRLIAMISDKARHYAVRAQQIKIEVTERGFIDVPKTTPVIQAFRQAGYEVAIDDFGTGYSNLHNLYSLNVDILKIDKSFIDTLTTNSTSHLIAEHIIEMAQSLRLKTIAEGVETAEQVSWLLKRGVQYCQGWHFAKAMPPQEFMAWQQQPLH
jgi:sensor c-di-GMP phosphodiesterase-like protein